MKYVNRKTANLLIFGCWFVYAVAYVGRLNYSACMVRLLDDLQLTNEQAGLVYSGFAVAYGVGQFVNGVLCRHYNPKFVVPGALLVSSVTNVLLPAAGGDYRAMAAVWLVNGAAQSILWSLLIRTLSQNITDRDISRAVYVLSTPNAAGTAVAYGLSALLVGLNIWQFSFYIAAVLMVGGAAVWIVIMKKVEAAERFSEGTSVNSGSEKDRPKRSPLTVVFAVTLACIGFTAVANGFVKDGITTWVPKLLTDEFSVSDSLSILLTLLLPLFSILGAVMARALYSRIKSHMRLNTLFYCLAFALTAGILFTFRFHSVAVTMTFFVAVACMMAAINNVITSMFPLDNRERMDSGLLAGVLDTLCYVGGALAGVVLGGVAQNGGWTNVFVLLIIACAGSAVLTGTFCLVSRFSRRHKQKIRVNHSAPS